MRVLLPLLLILAGIVAAVAAVAAVAGAVRVTAYDRKGAVVRSAASFDEFYAAGFPVGAHRIRVGTLPQSLDSTANVSYLALWQPFNADVGGGGVARDLVFAMTDFVRSVAATDDNSKGGDGAVAMEVVNADWGGVLVDALACDAATLHPRNDSHWHRCPDLIVLGTTQIAARVDRGDLLPLTDFFAGYAAERGRMLSDDFVKQYYYDFYLQGAWHALPSWICG